MKHHHAFSALPSPSVPPPCNTPWLHQIFAAKTAQRGGVVRRAVRDVEREIGRETLLREVKRRGFHLIECGGQFIIICNGGHLRTWC